MQSNCRDLPSMSGSSYYLDLPTASNPSRPSKRKRGSGSPEVGSASASGGGAAGGAGPSSRKRRTKSKGGKGKAKAKAEDEDDDREPTTEEEDSEDEPSTEEDEDGMVVEQPKRKTTSGPAEPAVLDLTDEGDDTASSPAPFASSSRFLTRPSGSRREGASLFGTADVITADSSSDDDDAKEKKPRSSRRDKGKGKGKARASSSPPPVAKSPSPAAADSSTASSVPLGPDGEPLPTLNHLTCPICFGPPAPLALTSCGHAFCAPCLHASLVAGPALTPPPESGLNRGVPISRGGGHGPVPAHLRGRLVSRGGSWSGGYRGGRGTAGAGSAGTSDDDGDPDLNKHCPVCRTALRGGWGKSLRGLVLRMGPAKKPS